MDIKTVTEEEKASWPKEVIVDLERPFVGECGGIQPLVDIDMRRCVLISSKKGTVVNGGVKTGHVAA